MWFFQTLQVKFDSLMVEINKPSLDEKANFFRLLAVSQKAGLWVRDSLKSLQQWEKNKWLLLIINDMIDKLTEWASLAEAMETQSYFFKSDEIELIRSTEITWNMVQTLKKGFNVSYYDDMINYCCCCYPFDEGIPYDYWYVLRSWAVTMNY